MSTRCPSDDISSPEGASSHLLSTITLRERGARTPTLALRVHLTPGKGQREHMGTTRASGTSSAVFVVSMVTMALLGVLFFAWRVAGLPFPPFDIFGWATRRAPGPLLAIGIRTMVSVIRALHLGSTSETAKLAEQLIAVAGLFAAGVVGGTLLFVILRAGRGLHGVAAGLVLGIVFGVPAALVSLHGSETASVGPIAAAAWVLGAFLVWGAVLGRTAQRLLGWERTADAVTDAAVDRMDRRRFVLRIGGASAMITVAGAVVGELAEAQRRRAVTAARTEPARWSATHQLPNAKAAVAPAPGTRPEFTPLERHYRIDINAIPPQIDERRWRLHVAGLVEAPLTIALEDLQRYEPMHQFVTLSCISNPVGGDLIGTTRWTGVSLQRLLPDLRLKPGATHLKMRSADQFFEVVSLDAIKADPRIMLTYSWDGVPLKQEHGFPLRIYIPDVHGMKQPKWIESVEAIDHWESGYWVERGWEKVAQVHATSVIDTIAVDMRMIGADRRTRVPIGGIAHAGARGISKVEVQVDTGPWEQAELRTPLSRLTWVIWRYDWPFQAGKHTLTVRCYDGNGTIQVATPSPPIPNGATGLDSRSIML
jgi:DMSO/TMAO reductase YedYZ molybdopterin-dependent catalytic subunit